ncbi:MAG: cupredoxin domain-containing protein [Jatrophihabitantaceae bacterium]
MAHFRYRTSSALTLAISATLLAAGCSSGGSGGGSGSGGLYGGKAPATSTSATTAAASTPAKAGIAVSATEQEFSITLSRSKFTAGTYTFTVHNAGKFQHNLTIEGPGVDKQASPTVPPGQSGTVTVTLSAGSYELWCSVDSHKDKGMDLTITIT